MSAIQPIPDPAEDEFVVVPTSTPDGLGRQRFFAFWKAEDALRQGQTRGQVFFQRVDEFTARAEERGKRVTVRDLVPDP